MKTPICDFVEEYIKKRPVRAHMPGHKGARTLGFENRDITEIFGADELYAPNGIIAESEKNASEIFGARTFYSAGGSTLSIQAMVYLLLLWAKKHGSSKILAARCAHRAFVNSCALLGAEPVWIFPRGGTYHSCTPDAASVEKAITATGARAVYITSPDYLGNISDIAGISQVCKKHGAVLAVDNAHGAYLKFLPISRHPIDLGADICCDSAHKTLPVITGGAYLHVSHNAPPIFSERAKTALSLFGSSSPSYLILQSLDSFNAAAQTFRAELCAFLPKIQALKGKLCTLGFKCIGDEETKITVKPKNFGTDGCALARHLIKNNIFPEFYDPDFTVLMLSQKNSGSDLEKIFSAFKSLERGLPIPTAPPPLGKPERKITLREALFAKHEILPPESCLGRVCAVSALSCPPAIPIAVCGEIIDIAAIKAMRYYNITECCVVTNDE